MTFSSAERSASYTHTSMENLAIQASHGLAILPELPAILDVCLRIIYDAAMMRIDNPAHLICMSCTRGSIMPAVQEQLTLQAGYMVRQGEFSQRAANGVMCSLRGRTRSFGRLRIMSSGMRHSSNGLPNDLLHAS